jgi:hypothetical protein
MTQISVPDKVEEIFDDEVFDEENDIPASEMKNNDIKFERKEPGPKATEFVRRVKNSDSKEEEFQVLKETVEYVEEEEPDIEEMYDCLVAPFKSSSSRDARGKLFKLDCPFDEDSTGLSLKDVYYKEVGDFYLRLMERVKVVHSDEWEERLEEIE